VQTGEKLRYFGTAKRARLPRRCDEDKTARGLGCTPIFALALD